MVVIEKPAEGKKMGQVVNCMVQLNKDPSIHSSINICQSLASIRQRDCRDHPFHLSIRPSLGYLRLGVLEEKERSTFGNSDRSYGSSEPAHGIFHTQHESRVSLTAPTLHRQFHLYQDCAKLVDGSVARYNLLG